MMPAAPRASCRLHAGARRGPVPDPGLRVLPPGVRRRGTLLASHAFAQTLVNFV